MNMGKLALAWRFSMNAKEKQSLSKKRTLRQLLSYALIGALTNLSGYAVYLYITYIGGDPKLTMTILYSFGALIGFFANRRFTFHHSGNIASAGIRYLTAQLLGYLLNLFLLVVFVDIFGFAHQIVQATAVVVVAIFLFVLSRIFVFAQRTIGDEVNRS